MVNKEKSIETELLEAVELRDKIQKKIGKEKSVLEYLKNKKYPKPPKNKKRAKQIADEWELKDLMIEGIVVEIYKKEETKPEDIFNRRGQIETFWKGQPFFYDKSKMFWLWDKENSKWVLSDEVDFCNLIYENLGIETINSKARGELVEGFKQIGRKHKPKDIEKSWIQFKDKIYDGRTGKELFEASPDYFATNPIPWKVGESEDTPTIDKLIIEWVGENYKETINQVTAYTLTPHQFMQRIIALVGGGSNGKGTYIKLLDKFMGEENIVSSEIKALSENRFETSCLHKKLLCVMGEVASDDLEHTNILKKIGGEDKLSFQFKGKNSFTEPNTATAICLTNSLPITPDKSIGFYRKWLLIDFPNQFKEIKDNPINKIPNVEFENLARKCLRILKELYENPKFINEGNFEMRIKRYEERSNPVMRFIEKKCEEDTGEFISLREFANLCNIDFKENHLRVMTVRQIGKILREEGLDIASRKINDFSTKVILNLGVKKKIRVKKKTTRTTRTTEKQTRFIRKETSSKLGSFGSSGSQEFKCFSCKNPLKNGEFVEIKKELYCIKCEKKIK